MDARLEHNNAERTCTPCGREDLGDVLEQLPPVRDDSEYYAKLKELEAAVREAEGSSSAAAESADKATGSAKEADESAGTALKSAGEAQNSERNAAESKQAAKDWADLSKSYAIGEGAPEKHPDEKTDNAKEYARQAKTNAGTASAGAKVVQDNKAALDAVKDNIEAIQGAAGNAEKAETAAGSASTDAERAKEYARQAQTIAQGALGYYEDEAALKAAHPTASTGNWAIVGTTDTIWIWDADTSAWTDSGQNIDLSNYYQKKEVDDALGKKQAKLTGTAGQAVGFDTNANAVGVNVGGRNLLPHSMHPGPNDAITSHGLATVEGTYKGFDVVHYKFEPGVSYADILVFNTEDIDKSFGTITFSWYMKGTGKCTCYFWNRNQTGAAAISGRDSYGSKTIAVDGALQYQLTSEWRRYAATWTLNPVVEGARYCLIGARLTEKDSEIYFCAPKLEYGSVATDWSPAPEDLQEKPTDGVFVPVYPNAGAHNSIYRGKNIQDKFNDGSLYTAIQNGTFEDLYIGDYFDITISTEFMASEKVRCLLAGFDVFWGCGDQVLNKHHAVIVPMNCFATSAKMNDGNDTTGGYANSKMHTETLPVYANALRDVFDTHLIKNREYMGTVMTGTTPSMAGLGWKGATTIPAWQDCELRPMSEVEVYGSTVLSSSAWDVGTAKSRLPLFTLAPNHIVCGLGGANYASTTARYTWWLSAVTSVVDFAVGAGSGGAASNVAGTENGVRPRWLIG